MSDHYGPNIWQYIFVRQKDQKTNKEKHIFGFFVLLFD